jgi:HD superfamily phosphohydrolase
MEFRGMEGLAVDALQAAELQRLRRIRQLGLAHLVFPGAEHSRFAHALGASFLTTRFSESLLADAHLHLPRSLQPDESIVRDLVIAALCHDLGHGPLSHAWEQNVIGTLHEPKRSAWMESLKLPDEPWLKSSRQWHELVTQALIARGELHDVLETVESGLSARVAALLSDRFYLPYLTRLFSSDVDVDRCDFILRDAHGSGVAYGRYDLDWLVSTITVGTNPANDDPVLGFDLYKAPRVVEQLLIARRAMYDTVYHHRAVRSAEGMVGNLLRRTHELAAINTEFLSKIQGFDVLTKAIAGNPLSTEEVLELDDYSLWVFIGRLQTQVEDKAVRDLAARVYGRQLFKPVPIAATRLDQMITSEHDTTMKRVDGELRRFNYENPEVFRFVDHAYFSFFHGDDGEGSWFVDTRDPHRRAQPISRHEAFVHHPHARRVTHTLYVPREAVTAVKNALDP